MPNMSYCRFENTFHDLSECYDFLCYNSIDELSESEKKYAFKLVKICSNIADEFLIDFQTKEKK